MTPIERRAFDDLLRRCPEGPRIEFGVFRGATLALIADHLGLTIGVDSFEGMAAPGPRDVHGGACPYPRGRLSAPMKDAARLAPAARLVKGFVPDVLAELPEINFAFAHLDMDQYAPTRAALEWTWARMAPGGVLCCDDWFEDRDWLAAGAINEFARDIGQRLETAGRKAWVTKMTPLEERGSAIVKRLPPGARAAEIGVLRGALSAFVLAMRPDVDLLMVDSWLTADKQPLHYRATGDVHANHENPERVARHRRETEENVRPFGRRATIMAMTSSEAASRVPDRSLDLVFLDADHSYEGVCSDLAAWAPKVKPGGWIGGHDYANPDPAFHFEVDRAVDEWALQRHVDIELDLNFTWFARI